MYRALQLATYGKRNAMPNPCVGAVIVYKDTIIGEGFTSAFGKAHAEVNAIAAVTDKEKLKEATLYVTLEPCNHYGKTPPCSHLIASSGIKKVVIGCLDPYEKVAGSGAKYLKSKGIDVVTGVLESLCKKVHKEFLFFCTHKQPYIILKWAESADGFIAPTHKNQKAPVWLSNEKSRQLSHKLRAENQAILVGTQTVLDDNPSLTTRDWYGKNPIRMCLDAHKKLTKQHKIYTDVAQTITFVDKQTAENTENTTVTINFKNLAKEVAKYCFENNIQTLIVEGGAKTLQTFIDANIWNEAWIFSAQKHLENGIPAPKINRTFDKKTIFLDTDQLTICKNPNL